MVAVIVTQRILVPFGLYCAQPNGHVVFIVATLLLQFTRLQHTLMTFVNIDDKYFVKDDLACDVLLKTNSRYTLMMTMTPCGGACPPPQVE